MTSCYCEIKVHNGILNSNLVQTTTEVPPGVSMNIDRPGLLPINHKSNDDSIQSTLSINIGGWWYNACQVVNWNSLNWNRAYGYLSRTVVTDRSSVLQFCPNRTEQVN